MRKRDAVYTAVIPAAGRGLRLGASEPKALFPICGRRMLEWSIIALSAVRDVGEIIVAAPADGLDVFEALRQTLQDRRWTRTIAGGDTRSESVNRLLECVSTPRVLVHDAARPCVRAAWVESLAVELGDDPAGIPALAVSDTLKEGAGGMVRGTLSRAGVFAVQTPQMFETVTLRRAHERSGAVGRDATDDASLVEALGIGVRLLPGDPTNLKVTVERDLEMAEAILERRRGRHEP